MSSDNHILFLGTGTSQGVPVIGCTCEVCTSVDSRDRRMRSSIHVKYNDAHIQIDAGPDFRQQLLQNEIHQVDGILFTHAHQDHIAGLDDTRPLIFKSEKNMPLYAQREVLDRIVHVFNYAFAENKYPGAPSFDLHEIGKDAFSINGTTITPLPVLHGNLPILGYRIGSMAYITDVKTIPNATLELLKNLDLLILDALHHEEHFSHLTLAESIELAQKINAKATYFIHMSHYMGKQAEWERKLPENMYFSYDGLKLPLQ